MVNENLIPKTETVYEIKNETQSVVGDQIPSYEEFMKNYEKDKSINYDDLSDRNIGEVEGYGPCTNSYCSCSNYELRQQLRQAKEELDNFWEKFKEYSEKWDRYRTYMENKEKAREGKENKEFWATFASEAVTAAFPIPFLGPAITDTLTGNSLAPQIAVVGEDKKSIYEQVCSKYSEIKEWYLRIRNKF